MAEPRERPILFSGPMVRAILREKSPKTVTRRIARGAPEDAFRLRLNEAGNLESWVGDLTPDQPWVLVCGPHGCDSPARSPYGYPGDRLWVRETFCPVDDSDFYLNTTAQWIDYRATPRYAASHPAGWDQEPDSPDALKWRPSIHMPRSASRLTLAVVSTSIERLQNISDEDARREGVEPFDVAYPRIAPEQRMTTGERVDESPYRSSFAFLWDEIHQDRPWWKDNPWVWRIEFCRPEVPHA